MTNKELYDKIVNNKLEGIKPVESLGYPYFKSTNTTTYLGSNLISKTALCEDTIDVPNQTDFTADVLIIGGGGGGGSWLGGGGGGAGGYREFTKKYYTGTNYTVTVGAGGSASSVGSDSSIERIGSGGGGGSTGLAGGSGGSGGGGDGFFGGGGGQSVSPRCNGSSQGNSGGGGYSFNNGGGGGGAGSVGTYGTGGGGGAGAVSTITGSSVTRGGGGGGGNAGSLGFNGGPGGSGGSGGGGDGGTGNESNNSSLAAGENGTANTGGGGGGGAVYKSSDGATNLQGTGGNGGSGFVCIKFPDTITITVGGGLTYTSSTSGGYTTVQFTAGTDNIYFDIDPYFNAVSLLLQDSFTDESSHGQTIVVEGDTALSTSEVKVGSYSFAFDDTGDRLTISSDSAFAFGTGDYTIETWLFIPTHATTRQVRILSTTNTTSNFSFEVQSTGALRLWTGSSLLSFGGTAVTQGQWHHVAFCRASGVVRAFVDGSQIGSAISNTTNMVNNQNIQLPSTNSYAGPACYMDGIRVTKAARYVSAFFPPTRPFPT